MGFLRNLVRSKKRIRCPRCLSKIDVDDNTKICKECSFELPIRYMQNYQYCRPLMLQVFGWTNHGKTVYLYALRLMLLDMAKLWPGFTQLGLTDLDLELDRKLRASLKKGTMPPGTDKRDRRPDEVYLLELDGIPRWGAQWLMMMDFAGELFSRLKVNAKSMPYLIETPTTFMLISLPMLTGSYHRQRNMTEPNQGESMDQLLSIYIETMLLNKVDFRKERRELIIVLTMGDEIVGLPPTLRKYLTTDDTWQRLRGGAAQPITADDLVTYLGRMREIDAEIKTWLRSDSENAPGGANLVALIDRHGISARFSLISATGHPTDPDESKNVPISPRRVLDPFYWALEFQQGTAED